MARKVDLRARVVGEVLEKARIFSPFLTRSVEPPVAALEGVRAIGAHRFLFLDDNPTYRFFVPVHYYLGRAQEGLKSPAAAESYKTFLAIKEKGDEQGIVIDARRRVGSGPR